MRVWRGGEKMQKWHSRLYADALLLLFFVHCCCLFVCVQRERKVDHLGRAYGTGRRKTSVARVWIKEGSGQFVVNNKSIIEYFAQAQREHLLEPFKTTDLAGDFDVVCTASGGGITGQAGAIRLGLSRALEAFQPELRPPLSRGNDSWAKFYVYR